MGLPVWSRAVEGRRKATDRLVTMLVSSAFVLAMFPLFSILWTVVSKGTKVLSAEFFTYSMRNVVGEGGGIYHALGRHAADHGRSGGHLDPDRHASRRSTSSSTPTATGSRAGSASSSTS